LQRRAAGGMNEMSMSTSTNAHHECNAEFLESALLRECGFRHAFFTRNGGVSTGAYASLSFSIAAGDDERNVERNLECAASVLGVDSARIHFLSQVHGRATHTLDGSEEQSRVLQIEGDALVSRVPSLACAVRSADCVPVFLADRRSGAVAAAHAGWRGAVQGVVSATVEALRELAPTPI